MGNHKEWLEEELARAEKAIERIESEVSRGRKSPQGLTEQEVRDLEYHYFKIAQIVRKLLGEDRFPQD